MQDTTTQDHLPGDAGADDPPATFTLAGVRFGQLSDRGQLLSVGVVDVKRIEVAAELRERGLGARIRQQQHATCEGPTSVEIARGRCGPRRQRATAVREGFDFFLPSRPEWDGPGE